MKRRIFLFNITAAISGLAVTKAFAKMDHSSMSDTMYTSLNPSANPFTGLFAATSHIGILGYALIGLILLSVGYLLKKKQINSNVNSEVSK